jgi:hypothetical protein
MPTSRNLPQKLRQQILVPGALCHWCGATATECDHLIEHDRGGDDSTSNLVPACKKCNATRGAIYKAKKQAHIMQQRNAAIENKNSDFFTEKIKTPHPPNSLFLENQPELAETGGDQPRSALTGRALPRLESARFGDLSHGPAVAAWAKKYMGVTLMDWQLHALSGQLECDDTGKLLRSQSLVETARQQGKTVALSALLAGGLQSLHSCAARHKTF